MSVKKILEGRWFGHPLHPLIVHLPLGLWLLGVVFDVVAFAETRAGRNEFQWAFYAGGWSIFIGTLVAVLAVITGLNDFLDIREDHPAQRAALWHMGMMLPATGLFAIDTVLHFAPHESHLVSEHVALILLIVSCAAYGLAIVGGYIGGLLVYDHGIGVGRHRRGTELPQLTIHEPRKGTTETALAPSAGLGREFRPVIPENALAEGSTLRVEFHGTVMVLARAGGRVYAVQEFCTHRCGPLSEGKVCPAEGNNQIECPWHKSRFDLATGKPTHGPAKVDLKTFEVRVEAGIVHVRMPTGEMPARTGARRNPQEGAAREEREMPRDGAAVKAKRGGEEGGGSR